ncbi:MAG: UbiA family prenyltransferase [Proteobacteria bacterium]|nr:UbiA family prenyltransferase [Pseudomonadota bacterium]MBU1611076.1 UbiA family prenyltransferase [Pseudomonadota bacterium]
MNWPVLQLARPKVSLAVTLGSLCGALFYVLSINQSYNLSQNVLHSYNYIKLGTILLSAFGSFFLCAGCSALNQVQERWRDGLMERTCNRPLPTKQITARCALAWGGLWAGLGLAFYYVSGGWPLLRVGMAVLFAYNGLYTPLKPATPLALLAGGVAGALPPLTGWLAAGGSALDPPILTLTAIFYLWQVPHFWLLAEKRRDDYLRAGYALPCRSLSPHMRKPLLALWIAAYFIGLSVFAIISNPLGTSSPLLMLCLLCLATGLGLGLAILSGRDRFASATIDGSLPLALGAMLLISL